MDNSAKYNFSDFTRGNYKKLLLLAKKNYNFIFYGNSRKNRKTILLRHDIDFSVNSAYTLAKIESGLKIKSTFFILPHSDFYNILEPEITGILLQIIKMGHKIGLHFDSQYYGIKNEIQLKEKLRFEKKFFEKLLDTKIEVFSFHNPDDIALSFEKYKYEGMINTYATIFKKEIAYISDSNGYWRHKRLEDLLNENSYKDIQILLHPEWWQDKVMSPKERVWRCIDGRAEKTRTKYLSILKKFKRNHIDW